jgi:hypothetical protein
MSESDNNSNPHGFKSGDFAPAGEIILSDEARSRAKEFLSDLNRYQPGAWWVVGFIWCSARTMRENKESKEIDEGPGIDLGGYRTWELPSEAIEIRDGVPMAFIIPT